MEKTFNAIFGLFCYFLYIINFVNGDCTISANGDITDPQVLILRPEGGKGINAFFMPDLGGDTITFSNGQTVFLSCGIRNFRINGVNIGGQSANAICTGNTLRINGQNVPFSAVSCSQFPVHSVRFTDNTCLGRYREFEIGIEVDDRYIVLMTGCFDDSAQTTLHIVGEVPASIEGYQVSFPRPTWAEPAGVYNLNGASLNTLYTRNTQRGTINRLLGLEESSTKYVHGTNNFYLARGHLAAKTDFIYGSQQRATFYFLNAAPQWQMFNQANWLALENNIRQLIINSGKTYTIYTGSYGVSTLPHEHTNEHVQLYLYADNNNNRAIPVPQLFWKALYEPSSKVGTVFIGVNNPYYFNAASDIICPDICDKISWLTWNPTNVTRGYSYCCTVDAFRSATGLLPDFEVLDLLT